MSDLSAGAAAVGQSVNKYSPDLASIRFTTSTYGKVTPIVWGQARLSANLIWTGAYLTQTAPVLGSTDAHANVLYGVCEGPILGFGRAWAGQNFYQTIAAIPHHPALPAAESFLGSYLQNPPAWLSSQFPSQALSYRGLAYVSAQQVQMGTGGALPSVSSILNLPNLNFEVIGTLQVGSDIALAKLGGDPSLVKTFTASSPTLSSTGHGFTEFQNVRLSSTGTLPAGLLPGVDYACANVTANSFQLKINPWDAAVVAFSGAGTGTHSATPYFLDANPGDVLFDFLTNVNFGAGFPSAQFADLTAFRTYCQAAGTFVSPILDTPEPAGSFLERLAAIAYSGIFFSENKLKVVPYCDTAITGNGATFTPNVTAVYALTDDDFKPEMGDDPVIVERRDPADAFNAVRIEFQNRFSQYSTEIVEIRDEAAIGLYGYRPKDTLTLHEIKDPAVAKWVAAFLLFREQAVANTYKFRLPAKYLLLEPMDLLTLTESTGTPLVNVPVRITEAGEEQDGFISIIADDFPTGSAIGVRYPNQASNLGYSQNYNSDPGNVNPPVFIGPYVLSLGEVQIWMGLSGRGNFGGCDVWGSYDDSSGQYKALGTVLGRTTTGVLSTTLPAVADPDNTTVLGVDLSESEGTLASVTAQQAANGEFSLCYVGGELFSYTNAIQTGPNQFNLTSLRRGLFGTPIMPSPSGSRFMFVNDPFFRFPKPPEFTIGRTLYLKFPAFNQFGAGKQAVANVAAYPIVSIASTPIVIGEKELPSDVTQFTIEGEILSWTLVADPGVVGYRIRYQPGTSRSWGDAIPLHTGLLTSGPFDMLIVPTGPVTIMIKAVNSQRGVNPDGNESQNAAYIVTDLGDPIVANIVETWDRKAAGFPGVKTNCSVSGGNLVADSITPLMWKPDDSAAMWSSDPSTLVWATVQYARLQYTDELTFALAGEGSILTIQSTIAGDPWSIEYRENSAKAMWDADGSKLMWGSSSDLMWDLPDFLPWPGQIAVKNSLYDFRIDAGQANAQGVVSEFTLIVDMPDIDEHLNDIVISSGGTRLPITKSYRAIKNIQLTVQADGGSAISARIDDKNVNLGPLIHGLDAAGSNTGALVDARIQGY